MTPGAEKQTETQPAELRIKTAADLEEALTSPDFGVRLQVLASVASQPQAALRYGKNQGRDLIDLLIEQINTLEESTLRQGVLTTLAVLPGRRVREALKKELYLTRDPRHVEIAATRLAREEPGDLREIFAPLLMQEDTAPHARAAALAMAGLDDLSLEESLRAALVGPGLEGNAPELKADSFPAWRQALAGPHGDYARRLLEQQGGAAFRFLASQWEQMPIEDRAWLLNWGAGSQQLDAVELMARALREGPGGLALTALGLAPSFGGAAGLFARAASEWAGHQDPTIRAAALKAGAQVTDLSSLIGEEEPEPVRLAAMERLVTEGLPEAAPALNALLEDSSWRVRSAAAAGLAQMGEAAVALLKRSAVSGSEPARTAAAGALLELGQDSWLQENLV